MRTATQNNSAAVFFRNRGKGGSAASLTVFDCRSALH